MAVYTFLWSHYRDFNQIDEFSVTVDYMPPTPARVSGNPDNWVPENSGTFNILAITRINAKMSDEWVDYYSDTIFDDFHDYLADQSDLED